MLQGTLKLALLVAATVSVLTSSFVGRADADPVNDARYLSTANSGAQQNGTSLPVEIVPNRPTAQNAVGFSPDGAPKSA
jgi:hypothetical protein